LASHRVSCGHGSDYHWDASDRADPGLLDVLIVQEGHAVGIKWDAGQQLSSAPTVRLVGCLGADVGSIAQPPAAPAAAPMKSRRLIRPILSISMP
jgi:hypothetical protein